MLTISRTAISEHREVSAVLATSAVFLATLLALGWAIA